MTQSLRDILICFRNLPHLFPFPKERMPSGALLVYCQRLNQSNHGLAAESLKRFSCSPGEKSGVRASVRPNYFLWSAAPAKQKRRSPLHALFRLAQAMREVGQEIGRA